MSVFAENKLQDIHILDMFLRLNQQSPKQMFLQEHHQCFSLGYIRLKILCLILCTNGQVEHMNLKPDVSSSTVKRFAQVGQNINIFQSSLIYERLSTLS